MLELVAKHSSGNSGGGGSTTSNMLMSGGSISASGAVALLDSVMASARYVVIFIYISCFRVHSLHVFFLILQQTPRYFHPWQ